MEPVFLSGMPSHHLCTYHSDLCRVILKEKLQLMSKIPERHGNDTKSQQKSQTIEKSPSKVSETSFVS